MEIYVRYIHNDMVKPNDNCGLESVVYSVTQKVLIIDTSLRLFIPPQVWKLTPRLRQIFGCDIFIVPKDMKIDLNIFKTKLVTDLQHNYVGRHTHNIAYITTKDSHNKDKVFPDGENLHATIKNAAQCISCTPIKPKNIINIKFALGFCADFPKYNIPDEELDDGTNYSLIHFSVYTYQGRRTKHGIMPNGPTL